MNDDQIDRSSRALATILTGSVAAVLAVIASVSYAWIYSLWFLGGYVAHRVLPKPAAPGIRAFTFAVLCFAAIATSILLRSWGPVLWFGAGWIAFATSYEPTNES